VPGVGLARKLEFPLYVAVMV
jgi:hypothetical protein